MNLTVTKETLIGEILDADSTTAPYFLKWECIVSVVLPQLWKVWKKPAWYTEFQWKNW